MKIKMDSDSDSREMDLDPDSDSRYPDSHITGWERHYKHCWESNVIHSKTSVAALSIILELFSYGFDRLGQRTTCLF